MSVVGHERRGFSTVDVADDLHRQRARRLGQVAEHVTY